MNLPWQTSRHPDADEEVTILVSELRLAQYRTIPRFLRMTQQVRQQLAQSEGLVGYTLRTSIPRHTFWTVSAWEDRRSLYKFVGKEPHGDIMQSLRDSMETTRFDTFDAVGHNLPMKAEAAIEQAWGT